MSVAVILVALSLVMTGCVTGPESEPKSPLNYANGDHYKVTDSVAGVPLKIERQAHATRVEGKALLDRSELFTPPLKFADVLLLDGDKVVAHTVTEENGAFLFSGQIPNGTYHVKAAKPLFEGETKVTIDGYEAKGIILKVKPKS